MADRTRMLRVLRVRTGEALCREHCADEWEHHGRVNPCSGCYLHAYHPHHDWCDAARSGAHETVRNYLNRYHNREKQ